MAGGVKKPAAIFYPYFHLAEKNLLLFYNPCEINVLISWIFFRISSALNE